MFDLECCGDGSRLSEKLRNHQMSQQKGEAQRANDEGCSVNIPGECDKLIGGQKVPGMK